MKVYGRIYLITNLTNQKKYVGLTTKTIQERFESHWNRATKERSAIQMSMKKYGKENFKIEEIEVAPNKEVLYERELYWIEHYNTFKGDGYNLTIGGGGITDMSQEIRDKISKSKTGKKIAKLQGLKRSNKNRLHISRQMGSKPVKGTHRETGEVIYLDYVTKGKEMGFNPSLISAVIYGKRNHHKGFIFEYVNYANPDLLIEDNESMTVQRIGDDPAKSRL